MTNLMFISVRLLSMPESRFYADNVLNSRKDILLVPRSGDITRQPERQIGLSTELRF